MAEKWVKMLVQGPSVPSSRFISLLEVILDHFFFIPQASKHVSYHIIGPMWAETPKMCKNARSGPFSTR